LTLPSGIRPPPAADQPEIDARIARMGTATNDPHPGERSYSRLAQLRGIAEA